MAAPFVDTARITVRSGDGGNGVVSFHREKYVAAGGPDGGDGDRGGNVVVVADDHMSTLMDFRYKRKYVAENGMDGSGKRCTGKNGADLVLKVPRGTVIRDAETQEIIQDISGNEPFILCRGGCPSPGRCLGPPAAPPAGTAAAAGTSWWRSTTICPP